MRNAVADYSKLFHLLINVGKLHSKQNIDQIFNVQWQIDWTLLLYIRITLSVGKPIKKPNKNQVDLQEISTGTSEACLIYFEVGDQKAWIR